jgi:hypothetical protein
VKTCRSLQPIYEVSRKSSGNTGKEILEGLFPMFLSEGGIVTTQSAPREILKDEIVKEEEAKLHSSSLCYSLLDITKRMMISPPLEVDDLVVKFLDIFLSDFGKWDDSEVFSKIREAEFEDCLEQIVCGAIKRSNRSKNDEEQVLKWILATDVAMGGHMDSFLFNCTIK